MTVSDFLGYGAENATRGRDLAELLHVDRRTLRRLVQRERLEGVLILSSSTAGGYYLAADGEEVRLFLTETDARIQALKMMRARVADAARRKGWCIDG